MCKKVTMLVHRSIIRFESDLDLPSAETDELISIKKGETVKYPFL